jgi:import inner membrane translocase subunit TIM17
MQQQQQPQQQVEHGREPCPDRILDDIGGAFGMGALGGGLWHLYRGLKNSPKGYKVAGALDVSGWLWRLSADTTGCMQPHCTMRTRGLMLCRLAAFSTPYVVAVQTVRREAPRMGGNFANWGLMFSVFDCTCLYIRKKVGAFACSL